MGMTQGILSLRAYGGLGNAHWVVLIMSFSFPLRMDGITHGLKIGGVRCLTLHSIQCNVRKRHKF